MEATLFLFVCLVVSLSLFGDNKQKRKRNLLSFTQITDRIEKEKRRMEGFEIEMKI